jgi:hypothetical protein
VNARALLLAALGAAAAVAAAGAGYFYFVKGQKPKAGETPVADPATFEGEDAEDALSVEAPPTDIPAPDGQEVGDALGSEGDPWLDPEGMEGEPVEGSGDFVEGEEPFEDVFAAPPDSAARESRGPVEDPIDPSELEEHEAPAQTPP